jgi:hypothetical protein
MNTFEQPASSSESDSKKKDWERRLKELENVVDGLGHPIEDGIKEAVVALNMLQFPTSGSCEGHDDWGLPTPWVQMEAANEPQYKFEGEAELWKSILEELNIKPEEVERNSPNFDWEKLGETNQAFFDKLPPDIPYTKEFSAWVANNENMVQSLQELIEEFYSQADDNRKERVALMTIGHSMPRVFVSDEMYEPDEQIVRAKRTGEDISVEGILFRLEKRREEMNRFMIFLKKKIFSGT